MKQINIRTTDALAKAVIKAAHRKEISQQQFIEQAIIKELGYLGDEQIDALVSAHEVQND